VENRDEVVSGPRAACLALHVGKRDHAGVISCLARGATRLAHSPRRPVRWGTGQQSFHEPTLAAVRPPTACLLRATSLARQEFQGPTCHNRAADRTYTSGRTAIGAVPAVPARCLMDKLLLTPVEAAGVLGVGRSLLYELLQRGELRSVRIGTCRRIPTEAIEEFLATLQSAS